MNRIRPYLWTILIILTSLALGFYGGITLRSLRPQFKILRAEQNKISEALYVISKTYVDSVDVAQLSESAVNQIVKELDPHSSYIPASDVETVNENLEATFGGIGIEFNMQSDTILVVRIISGGPAEKAGLMQFDRIVTVDDSIVAGKKINQNAIMKMLRGPKDSKVVLGIKRGDSETLAEYELTRGDIPNNSIEVSYQVEDEIGYIKISKFSRSTYKEFLTAIATLQEQGVTGYIIDLRNNGGGYLDHVIHVINEFFPKGSLIVYMEGQGYPRRNFTADGKGSCLEAPVVLLIDELSASASEIFAGAIQDHDRGTIIGRRSFGKGLVQLPIELSDNSVLLLSVARYFTPSGRCIQKEYELGNQDEYIHDLDFRYIHGEYYTSDSIKFIDSLEVKTLGGRTVYGGGGIMPDIFIPHDTTGISSYYIQLVNSGVLNQFAVVYSDKNYEVLKSFATYQEMYDYLKNRQTINELADYAADKGIKKRPTLMSMSQDLIETYLFSIIIRNFFNNEGSYPILMKDDPMMLKAIELIKEGTWRPVNQAEIAFNDEP